MFFKLKFYLKFKSTIATAILLSVVMVSCFTGTKKNSTYGQKVKEKGVLLHLQDFFYFFPLKSTDINNIQDLFDHEIDEFNGFRCEGFLVSVNTATTYMSMKDFDAAVSVCAYRGEEMQPDYIATNDFRIALVKMTYKMRMPNPIDELDMKKTLTYCIETPSEHVTKFKYNLMPETVYTIKILD